ncbi:MAG TPA: TonB-dependent receptor [Paucimonas sp.]|nr:TonB-dependent receptor [Paucimonas sp.]
MQTTNSLMRVGRTLIALAVASAFPLHAAWAQEAQSADAAEPAKGQLETVTVTAQRRAENIKEVPISISTLKGEKLDVINSSGADIRMLAARVPSLNIESSFGRSFPRFYVRGLGNTDFDLNASQPVSLVFDEIVQENPILKGFPIFDIEQVEVLRGPQGTLFGRNSPAGVVKFDSAKPTRRFEGYANASVATHKTVNLEGAVNVPLNDDWAIRLSMQAQHRDDWVRNTAPGPTREFEGYDDNAARLQFLYKPGKDFSALFNIHARDLKGSARLFRANILRKGSNDLGPNFRMNEVALDGKNEQDLDSNGANLRLRWDLGDLSLHSITGYEHVSVYSRGDIDGSAGPYAFDFDFSRPPAPGTIRFPAESADGLPKHRQLSQEFRVESNHKGPWNWLAGLYYFDEDIKVDTFDYATLAGNVQAGHAQQEQKNKAWALYGTVNYAVSDQLKLRGGLRYTDDKKDFTAQRLVSPFGAPPLSRSAHPHENNVSWDLSANYAMNKDTNLYARVATGFRAPSVQGRILFNDNAFSVANSETVQSYEAGIKQDLFNRRARLGFNVFHYTIEDMQLTAVGGNDNQSLLHNAEKAVGQGFELDFQANLSDAIQMTAGLSYNDTKIKDPTLVVSPCGGGCTVLDPPNASGFVRINGNPLPMAPKWVANFTLRYQVPMGDGDFFVFTDWAYRGKINFFLYESVEYTGKSLLEGGLRVGYKWDKHEIALFGRNITNQIRNTGGIDFNNLTGFVNEPRSWGVQFKTTF